MWLGFALANPQIEDGHVDLANDIVEALARINLSGREMRCLWVIFRKTYGWHKKTDLIALSQFSLMTGLSRQVVCKVLKSLLSKKIIAVDKNDNSQINSYRFNKDFDKWQQLPKKITLLSKKIITVDVLDNQVLSKKTHTKETLTKETIQKKEYSSNFLLFWENYPKKVGKPNAFKQWNKIKPNLEIVIQALNQQKEHKETLNSENKFCPEWPDPERWIKNKRWEDETQEDNQPTDPMDRRLWEIERMRKNEHLKPT